MATTVNYWSQNSLSDYKPEFQEILKPAEPINKENQLLLQKIDILQSMVDKLENEKDALTYTCSDLKQLLQCVAKQHDKNAERQRKNIKDLENKVANLKQALHISEIHSAHLSSISSFWEDVIRE
ncbi:unnamed protein product [Blepharisma stoltei]|uniref:Uncharacterized protein n=1 Tax=Blepharisma stoltei TaxID=1481888 RepID=A0AAU9JDR8_9CILI|nr:unnamed protein product [Blepharisma stoltei]